jgi:hypothetical protein
MLADGKQSGGFGNLCSRGVRLTRDTSRSSLASMKLLRRWIGLALLAPVLVLAVSTSSFIGMRCRMSGMVSLATCCPDADPGPVQRQSSIGEPGCCERVIVESIKPIASAASDGNGALQAPHSAAVTRVFSAESLLLPHSVRVIAAAPPRAFRPPLRLLKHSFLI